uniref:peptidylprolyl isomerase n=1 Tax=Acrobeloides nanus TaxID=290746 RepID=A0A914DBL8_9BILA
MSSEKLPFVVFETSMGNFAVELYWNEAPLTCQNFAELARRKYYNGTIFHRIVPEFIIQGGDPTGTGRGGASIYGDRFEDEISDKLKHTGAGILSMANSGPNTNGSQFYVTLAPAQHLDGKHTIFGRIAAGMWDQADNQETSISYFDNSLKQDISNASSQDDQLLDFGPANFVKGRLGGKVVIYNSIRYPGHVFRFGCQTEQFYFRCLDCKNIMITMRKMNKDFYAKHGNLKIACITVKDGRIVGVDPDNPRHPHLCMNPTGNLQFARTYKRKKSSIPKNSTLARDFDQTDQSQAAQNESNEDNFEKYVLNMTNRERRSDFASSSSYTTNSFLTEQVYSNATAIISPTKDPVIASSNSHPGASSSTQMFIMKEEAIYEDDVPSINNEINRTSSAPSANDQVNDPVNHENTHANMQRLREGDIGKIIQDHIDKLENERSPNAGKLRNVSRFVFGILMEVYNATGSREDTFHLEIGKLCVFVNEQQWMDLKTVYHEIRYLISKFS